jgi:uncharacterized ferritin-like protein (DUF455 family)
MASSPLSAPRVGTLDRWAWDYLATDELAGKFELGQPPRQLDDGAISRREVRPARPMALLAAGAKSKTPGPDALRAPARKARLVHTFLHHELQAAELMCWAILAYPRSPAKFRIGLAKIARDEVRHMGMYADYLASLGHAFGDFPVRDWFWERVPSAESPASFVATMGMGFEGGNLDHTRRFAERFRAVGDDAAARLEERIFEEEVPHVRFALTWFRAFTGKADFGSWVDHLPHPLSPMVMRGNPIERGGRGRAGFSQRFVDELGQWQCEDSGS